MKGIIFCGCSFTWGQGLYYYSDLDVSFPKNQYYYDRDLINDAHINYAKTLRYPRLVANHFNTFEFVKLENGGSEDESFEFIDELFRENKLIQKFSHITKEKCEYNDIDYIIIQLSQLYRNKLYFELNGVNHFTNISPRSNYGNYETLLKWMEVNNFTYKDWENILLERQYNRLVEKLKFYEEKGIKTKIICWEKDMIHLIKNDPFLIKRHIQLGYGNEYFDTIDQLQKKHKEMVIEFDYDFFGDSPPLDHHPSKLCHKVIADNIIKNIEKDLK
jgi:hypothetical protein